MSMKRFFSRLAILSLALGAGFASLPRAQAEPLAPIAIAAAPMLESSLPTIVPGSNLIEARYWRHYHRWHYRRWHHRHYRHWHYRHYRHWHHRHWHRR
jgi:hypothetical protein